MLDRLSSASRTPDGLDLVAPSLRSDGANAMTEDLLAWLAEVSNDPLAFALGAFPWGEPGTILAKYDGPLAWQREIMEEVRQGLLSIEEAIQRANDYPDDTGEEGQPIQLATASGHGVGKSALVSMLILWAFTTFPDCRGVVTANTETQLKTKTWAELGRWFNLCFFARDHFTLNATSLVSKDPTRERTWRIDMIAWSETNPEAFAGMHNKGKRLLIIFDEASAIADIIWETIEGATTDSDTQIIWLVFGNPTRNSGRFRECFGEGKHASMWKSRQLDSRTVEITNKARIARWESIYGADTDWFRVRVLGQFPRRGEMEFFSAAEIDAAMSPDREVFVDAFTPLALGVDVARFGRNNSVLFPRKGRDARTIERKLYSGLSTTELAQRVFDAFTQWRPDGIFIDGGGVGGGVVDQCRHQQLFVWEVQFGAKDSITGIANDNSGERYANMRAAMYGALRAWLKTGMLPQSPELRTAMLAIKYTYRETKQGDEIILTSKEDLLDENPDLDLDTLDALALTFGGPLARNPHAGGEFAHMQNPNQAEHEYDPYSAERMAS
jgi:hypothetical protein